jgi:hypothetical protein
VEQTMFDMFGYLVNVQDGAIVLGEFGGIYATDKHPKKTIQRVVDYTVDVIRENYAGGYMWSLNPESSYEFNPADKNGFFQEAILGDGDTLSSTSWINRNFFDEFIEKRKYITLPAKEYVNSMDRPSVCYLEGKIYHLWHGDNKKRQYTERRNILRGITDIRDIIKEDTSGIYALKDQSLKARIMKYFRDRDDDGI